MEIAEVLIIKHLILIATLGMLIFIAFLLSIIIVYLRKQKKHQFLIHQKEQEYHFLIRESVLKTEQSVRSTIAADLHDEIGARLNALKLFLTKMTRNIDDRELTLQLANESKTILDDNIQRVKKISRKIIPAELKYFGLEHAIVELINIYNSTTPVNVNYFFDTKKSPPGHIQFELYFMVSELLNNILKHSHSKKINIEIHAETEYVIRFVYDGSGITNSQLTELSLKGNGIRNLQERAVKINAKLDFESLGKGLFGIEITVPLNELG